MTKMNDKQKTNERAVSPVIGVILMVAITVILAAVIGAFVLGLGDQVGNTAPSASFDYDWNGTDNLTITHDGGDSLDPSELTVVNADDSTNTTDGTVVWGSDDITAGDSGGVDAMPGDTIRIVWESDSGQSSTISTYEVPT